VPKSSKVVVAEVTKTVASLHPMAAITPTYSNPPPTVEVSHSPTGPKHSAFPPQFHFNQLALLPNSRS